MKILHLGKYYPPVKGGMESVLRDICEGLLASGHELRVLAAATDGADHYETLDAEARGRLIRCSASLTIASQPLTLSLPRHMADMLRTWRPDVVQVHLPNPLGAAVMLWHLRHVPKGCVVTVWHHADVARRKLGRSLVRPLNHRLLSQCAGIAVSSQQLRDHSRELAHVRDKTVVIPFGIDVARWSCPLRSEGGDFLFVGRLVYYKGLDLLIDALLLEPRARVRIVGRGPVGSSLQRRIRAENLADRVEMLGEVDEEGVLALMRESRALVLPSDHGSETFGVVQLEAMAAGLPVLSTSLPTGVAAVNLHQQTGLSVPPGDASALATAMGRFLDDPVAARLWGEAGRRRVCERFNRTLMIERLVAWYRRLGDEAGRKI